jgi:hypothetical protein
MILVRLVVIVALFLSGPAMGDSLLEMMIEVGGDNKVADWENNLNTPYVAGSSANDQMFLADGGTGLAIVTWDVVIALTGTHSDGNVPNGVANIVFDLELRNTQTGELVALGRAANTIVDGDNPTGPGFFSTTNDGDADGLRGSSVGPDPLHNAAFTRSFAGTIGIAGTGRVWDQKVDGGPRLDRPQYPSAAGYPTGSVAANGKLVGMGTGYSLYTLSDDIRVPGVGGIGSCQLAVVPVAEGQIALEVGRYTLKVVPDTANNILRGDFDCTTDEPRSFALPVDQATGSEINFIVAAPPKLESAASIKLNAFAEEFGIDMKLAGSADPLLVEPRNDGPTRTVFTFDQDVDITGASVTLSVAWNMYTPTLDGIVPVGTDGMEVQASGIVTADLYNYCLKVDISGVTGTVGGLAMDPVRYLIMPLLGDVNGDGWTDTADINLAKDQSGEYVWGTTGADFRRDFNLDGWVDSGDINLAKARSGNSCYCDE